VDVFSAGASRRVGVAVFSDRASRRVGKNELILQKKIIRLAFFGSFFGNEKKNKTKLIEFKIRFYLQFELTKNSFYRKRSSD